MSDTRVDDLLVEDPNGLFLIDVVEELDFLDSGVHRRLSQVEHSSALHVVEQSVVLVLPLVSGAADRGVAGLGKSLVNGAAWNTAVGGVRVSHVATLQDGQSLLNGDKLISGDDGNSVLLEGSCKIGFKELHVANDVLLESIEVLNDLVNSDLEGAMLLFGQSLELSLGNVQVLGSLDKRLSDALKLNDS